MIIEMRAFCTLCLRMVWLRNTISVSLIVKSSSVLIWIKVKIDIHPYIKSNNTYLNHYLTYVPDLKSDVTEGRIHSGGTRILVRIKSFGCVKSAFISSRGMSSEGMFLKRKRTFNGLRISWAFATIGSISLLNSLAIENDSTISLTITSFFFTHLYLSWRIFKTPHFLTVPWDKFKKNESFFRSVLCLMRSVFIIFVCLLLATIEFAAVEANVAFLSFLVDFLSQTLLL